ncbi:hypothetical protein WH5701_12398 [Synechococcus sp. WH 5701]|nr:hypothetical protein WH5701_12398 [Synechococcus sp. WH 5701]
MQRNSFGEGWAYRLDQHALELQRAQQSFLRCALLGFSGVKRGLRDRHAKLTCAERDLGDKSRGSIGV